MRRSGLVLVLVALVASIAIAAVRASGDTGSGDTLKVVVVGDIACSPSDPFYNGGLGQPWACQQAATAKLTASLHPDRVLLLGDLQYENASTAEFEAVWKPTWGRFDPIAVPTPGNHEYVQPGAADYFGWFGARVGSSAKSYYSVDLAAWHVVSLNANCTLVPGGCKTGSLQEKWLKADLAAATGRCTIAMWHQPRWGSKGVAENAAMTAMWTDLYAARAELILNGHYHMYERFAPMTASGAPDTAGGVRQIIVGTGGEDLDNFGAALPTSRARVKAFGVLELTLAPTSYSWRFIDLSGTVRDSGTGTCH